MSQLLVKILFLLIALKFIKEIYRRVERFTSKSRGVLPQTPKTAPRSPDLPLQWEPLQPLWAACSSQNLPGAGLGRNSSRGKGFFHIFFHILFLFESGKYDIADKMVAEMS